jgi:hypothetical protein
MAAIATSALPDATFRRAPGGRSLVSRAGTLASKVHYHWGPNLIDGEVVLGVEPKRGHVLTDRRLATMQDDALYLLRYADLVEAHVEKRLLGGRLRLVTEGGGLSLREERDALHEFFANVVKLLPDDRRIAAPPVEGPAKVERALASGDARVLALSRLLAARVEGGTLAGDAAETYARRLVLVDRTLLHGRGMDEAFSWLAALSARDLLAVISERLGPGLEPSGEGDGVYELTTTGGGSAVGVGLALGGYGSPGMSAAIGGVTAGGATTQRTRLAIAEAPDATRFSLQVEVLDEWTAFAYAGRAAEFDAVMGDVLAYELTGTLLRLLFGEDDALEDLVGRARGELAAAAAALDPAMDLSSFWAP